MSISSHPLPQVPCLSLQRGEFHMNATSYFHSCSSVSLFLLLMYVASQLIQGYSFANLRCHWAVIVGWLQKFSVGWKTDDNEDRFMMSVGTGKM